MTGEDEARIGAVDMLTYTTWPFGLRPVEIDEDAGLVYVCHEESGREFEIHIQVTEVR